MARFDPKHAKANPNIGQLYQSVTSAKEARLALEEAQRARAAAAAAEAEKADKVPDAGGLVPSIQSSYTNQRA